MVRGHCLVMAEGSCAVASPGFHIVLFRHRRKLCRFAFQLPRFADYDLRPPVVALDIAVNFDELALELAHIANVPQVGGKNYCREGAGARAFAKCEIVRAILGLSHVGDGAANAFGFADVLAGLGKRNARRAGDCRNESSAEKQK